jgi:hypothetical protein
MRHPRSLSEGRHNRWTIIARRRHTILTFFTVDPNNPEDNRAWFRCAKWNLNCGCRLCHCDKYDSSRRKRRDQLRKDIGENLVSWAAAPAEKELEVGESWNC